MTAADVTAIDAVLPLRAQDYERSRMLLLSLGRHFKTGKVLVVVPASQVEAIRQRIDSETFETPPIDVLPEQEVVPEFHRHPRMKGWYKQQLIKLAAADWVSAPYYITLDADVVCTRPVTAALVLKDGKAPCFVLHGRYHASWYRNTRKVLALSAPRPAITHNVTPAILAVNGVRQLAAALEERVRQRQFSSGWLGFRQRLSLRRQDGPQWRAFLAASVPWTEYALYYTFLEESGSFDAHHFVSEQALYASDSIWRNNQEEFVHWSPTELFEGDGPPFFVVVQSNTQLSLEEIRNKFEPYLPGLHTLTAASDTSG